MIDIDKLTVRLGDAEVLRELSLQIEPGQLVCLAGPNGAGKSTLLRCLVGLLRPTTGTVNVDGIPPGSGRGKRLVGYVPDTPLLYDTLTPREHLEFLGRLWGVPPAPGLLEEFGLTLSAEQYAFRLSLGQRQRLSLAIATYHQPSLLVLDEPFNGLDEETGKMLIDLLDEHVRSGGVAVVATHTLANVAGGDRLLVLRDGEVAADWKLSPGADIKALYRKALANRSGSADGELAGVAP